MNKISTLLFLIFLTCTSGVFADSGSSISLNGTWELSYWMQPEEPITSPKDMQLAEVKHLSAQVPGNVELDLMAANLIKDPMIGSNVNELRKWEGYQWCYSKSFVAPQLKPGQQYQLFFETISRTKDCTRNRSSICRATNDRN